MDAILLALAKGNNRKTAAAAGGVSYQTLREWEKDFPEFAEAVEKAEGQAQQDLLARILYASQHGAVTTRPDGTVTEQPGAWQAAAWILERRWPRDYGRREAVEMSGPDGGPLETLDVGAMKDHERRVLADVIRDELRRRREHADAPHAEPTVGAAD